MNIEANFLNNIFANQKRNTPKISTTIIKYVSSHSYRDGSV